MEDSIPVLLKQIGIRMRQNADNELRKDNLTLTQVHVLSCLRMNGGSATQKEVENNLNVSHATVAGLVSRLQKNGYVAAQVDPGDRRNRLLSLTEKAKRHAVQAEETKRRWNDELLSDFTEEQKEELRLLLKKLMENLEKQQMRKE